MESNERRDPLTGEYFFPKRRNQRFANEKNRIAYHNRNQTALRDIKSETDRILEKNRQILQACLNGTKQTVAKVLDLQLRGFEFNYLTQVRIQDKQELRLVYNIAYYKIKSDTIKIIKDDGPNT